MSNSHDWMKNYYTSYSHEKRSINFAGKILDNLSKIGITKRKAEGACYVVIREHNVPAVLIENGFHTNDDDRAKLSDDKFLDKLASAYVDAVLSYFGEIEPETYSTATMAPPATSQARAPQYINNAINANGVKVSLNGHAVKLTESPIFFEGELYFNLEDIVRIAGYACDTSGIFYRDNTYILKNPVISGEKLFISAAELLSIQKSVLWAEVKIDANVKVKFKINKQYEPKWNGPEPTFFNGELCVPLEPVLRVLGYTSDFKDGLLTIYRKGEPVYGTQSEYMFIGETLHMTASQLNAIKNILWTSFDAEFID
jgi:hypothetical protein